MTVKEGILECELYKGAFSGEVVFAVQTEKELYYKGVVPKHYANFKGELSANPSKGSLQVRVMGNGGAKAKVATPDGGVFSVPAQMVQYAN